MLYWFNTFVSIHEIDEEGAHLQIKEDNVREEIDYAKPCLSCDQHVHSTNLLLRKHVRSQICDNCTSELVSVRCVNDNLILCQECDWDVHGTYFMAVPQLLIWLPYGVSGRLIEN
ncbi:hypothetical protein NC651_028638 [Populus alba x Populus x berolinensis]|nr:hypothetical protein NC651_028638 [Populus alba x Populus x berolinensis]